MFLCIAGEAVDVGIRPAGLENLAHEKAAEALKLDR